MKKYVGIILMISCLLFLSGCITTDGSNPSDSHIERTYFKSGQIIDVVIHNSWFDFVNTVDIYFNDGLFVRVSGENENYTIYSLYVVSKFNIGNNCSISYYEMSDSLGQYCSRFEVLG